MLYLYISLPQYTVKELKSDIISSWCNYNGKSSFQFIWSFTLDKKEKQNISDPFLDEFPSAKDLREVNSWRVEYDENIHPVAINRNYKYDFKEDDIVANILR